MALRYHRAYNVVCTAWTIYIDCVGLKRCSIQRQDTLIMYIYTPLDQVMFGWSKDLSPSYAPSCIKFCWHYSGVILSAMASPITGVSIVYSTVCTGPYQRKQHKRPVTRIMCEFDDVIMSTTKDLCITFTLCRVSSWLCIQILPMSFSRTSLALWQSHDWPNASRATL